MDRAKINRINELAAKNKTVGLTEEELAERDALRREYLDAIRANFRKTLESITVVDSSGEGEKPGAR